MGVKIEYSANFKRNYVAFFAFVFFFAMIGAELVLALSIPYFAQREDAYAKEIRKREMILMFDSAQRECRAIPEKNEAVKMEKMLLTETLDLLAVYQRAESDRLSEEDVNALLPLVTDLHRIAGRLAKGISYSRENKLNSTRYIDFLISKRKVSQ